MMLRHGVGSLKGSSRFLAIRPLSPFRVVLSSARYQFSTQPAEAPACSPLQKMLWESYVASGRGARDLFHSIDTDSNERVSPEEVEVFIESVRAKAGCRPEAFKSLRTKAINDELDLKGFLTWLVEATKFSDQKSSKFRIWYESSPLVGERALKTEEMYSWNETTMNQSLRRMQYAVRGEVVMRADELKAEGREITFTNVGNPQAVGQEPITFYRQVLALCDLPEKNGVDHPQVSALFPADVVQRARDMRAAVGEAGTGAYTHSQGIAPFRRHVAEYIMRRDGQPAFFGDIFLTNGASSGIQSILTTLISSDHDAIMIPIPQYPIYSALITLLGGRMLGYELDEELGWAVTEEELQKQLDKAREQELDVKGMALINPGNPTGQVMEREVIEVICKFCARNGIVLLADEVYQRNVYAKGHSFTSVKKVAVETDGCQNLQLVSFHSTSKGLIGECGRRGGYMELHGIDPYIKSQLYKLASAGLCSCVAGQIMTSLMVTPPFPGDESYEEFAAEEKGIFDSLSRRASALVDGLNAIDGIECQTAEGSMYAFPSITIPQGAIDEAELREQSPDTLYALSLLEETGICVVPASGFGQKEGRIGFRTTFLPPEAQLLEAIEKIAEHHKQFCDKYS